MQRLMESLKVRMTIMIKRDKDVEDIEGKFASVSVTVTVYRERLRRALRQYLQDFQ
jgi:hypothetical protein